MSRGVPQTSEFHTLCFAVSPDLSRYGPVVTSETEPAAQVFMGNKTEPAAQVFMGNKTEPAAQVFMRNKTVPENKWENENGSGNGGNRL